jgi:hypothetical protein
MKFNKWFLALSTSVMTSWVGLAECPQMPIGGSEHSFGVPGPVIGEAIDAYAESNEVQAQVELLKRHSYCPVTEQPEAVEVNENCDEAHECSYEITLKQNFQLRRSRPKTVIARYHKDRGGRVMIEVESMNLRGIGREVSLSQRLSQEVFAGLSAAGITDPRNVMGSMRLTVGRVLCSQAVVPHPVPSCTLINQDAELELDSETSKGLMRFLLSESAIVGPRNIVGAVNVGTALLTCESGVYPGAKASCTAVIEKRVE